MFTLLVSVLLGTYDLNLFEFLFGVKLPIGSSNYTTENLKKFNPKLNSLSMEQSNSQSINTENTSGSSNLATTSTDRTNRGEEFYIKPLETKSCYSDLLVSKALTRDELTSLSQKGLKIQLHEERSGYLNEMRKFKTAISQKVRALEKIEKLESKSSDIQNRSSTNQKSKDNDSFELASVQKSILEIKSDLEMLELRISGDKTNAEIHVCNQKAIRAELKRKNK